MERATNDSLRGYLTPITQGGETPYVSIGFSADYPDLCLITVSNPDAGLAMQFVESRDNPAGTPYKVNGGPMSANGLDPSLTQWNATAHGDGYITLKHLRG